MYVIFYIYFNNILDLIFLFMYIWKLYQDEHFTDDYMAYINDDKDSGRYSIDDMDFDHEEEKVVEKEVVMEQVSGNNVTGVQKEEATPLKKNVVVPSLTFFFKG